LAVSWDQALAAARAKAAEAGVAGSYTGIDINDERWGHLQLPPEFPGRLLQLDAHELDQLNDRFDFAISLTAFEHFADDKQVAWGMAHVLKPGAHALIAVPAPWSFPLYGPHGYRRYTAAALQTLAAEAGLEIVAQQKISGLGGWLFHFHWFFPAALLRNMIKVIFVAFAGGNKQKARRHWPRLFAWLDGLGNHHLRWSFGRWLHRAGLRLAARLDRYLPLLEVGWLAVFRKS